MGGHDPYSASKGAAEIAFSAYARSYFTNRPELGAASARAGKVIGGGDWAEDRILPDCIRAIENGKSINIRNPNATRPWQHVLEPISGYLTLAYNLRKDPRKYEGSWNFGPPSSEVRTVEQVVKSIINYFGKGEILLSNANNKVHEANLLQLNCDKAHQLLNWKTRWNVEETLAATAEWYKFVLEGNPVEEITKKQLKKYFKDLI
jgi:CDP-glucose 4,6-dehydratase